jgi:chitodextrinase
VAQLAPLSTFAAQSTFTTSLTTYGTDTTPPTVPTGLTATAVSSSQIDLSWNPSTDDFTLVGYSIYRDAVLIANIAGTTYSDTGLAPETAYTYTVTAIDASNNVSAESDPATATTSAVIIPPTPPVTTGGVSGSTGSVSPVISNLTVQTEEHQALIRFQTNVITQAKVYWGKTHEYEAGSISVLFYGKDHEVTILGLQEGTTYFGKIEVTDSRGYSVFTEVMFTTKSPAVVSPLPNPSDFSATPFDSHIQLSWTNPLDPRFKDVRIVRSEKFFPKDPNDGVPIYEGGAQAFRDSNVIPGTTYYYGLFARDVSGIFSSGALTQARIVAKGEIATPPGTDPFESIPNASRVDPIIERLTLADFDFIQQGRTLINIGNETIGINGGVPLTIRLKYEKVPEILKTIAFTLVDPEDSTKVFPFLLRANADKTYYEATIGSLGRSGNYALNIVVLDYQNQGLKRIHGNIRALVFSVPADIRRGFDVPGFMFFILLIIIVLIVLSRRRHDDDRPATVLPPSLDLSTEK